MYDGIAGFLNMLLGMCVQLILSIADDVNIDVTSKYSTIWSKIISIADGVIVPIGIMIVITFFLLAVMDKASSENLTLEVMLKEIIKLALGLYLVSNAVDIVTNCILIGNGIVQSVVGVIDAENLNIASFTGEQIKGMGGIWSVLLFGAAIVIFMLIEIVIILIMRAIAIVRLMEILVRASMAPLALADSFAGNFLQSHAMNFIKSFTAVCIQGAFILIIAYLIPAFMQNIAVNIDTGGNNPLFTLTGIPVVMNALSFILQMLIVSIGGLVLMFKSGSIAKEIMGAR